MDASKPSLISALWAQKFWVYTLMIVAGIGLGVIKYTAYQNALGFAENGVEVVGEITNMSDYPSSTKKSFSISYTFVTPDDPYVNGQQQVSQLFYEEYTEGDLISVTYMPSDPTQSVVEMGKLASGFGVTMLAALGLILGGAAGGIFSFLRARGLSGSF